MSSITLPRATVEQALEALEEWHGAYPHRVEEDDIEVAEALRAALAQQAEPVCTDCRGLGYDASGQLCWCQQNPSF